jgi:hypothetical protein
MLQRMRITVSHTCVVTLPSFCGSRQAARARAGQIVIGLYISLYISFFAPNLQYNAPRARTGVYCAS